MKYLVTGGCGFIGSHIAEALVRSGHDVHVYDNLSSGCLRNVESFRDDVDVVEADIRDSSKLEESMRGMDGVFHEAALVSVFDSVERPLENHSINIAGTLNVLETARRRGVRRVLFAASAAAYGNDPELPKRETMMSRPESPYGAAKVAGELYAGIFAKLYGIETVSLRYFNVYGPRQDPKSMYSGVISRFTDLICRGENPVVFGDGGQTRDFVFVEDVVQANVLAMTSSKVGKGEILNVGTGRRTSLLDLLAVLRDLTGRSFEIEFQQARTGDIRDSVADISMARSSLGYEPRFDIREGLRRTGKPEGARRIFEDARKSLSLRQHGL